jgi:hypothetical protein
VLIVNINISTNILEGTNGFRGFSPAGIKTEECYLLRCGAVLVYYKPMFRRKVSSPSSGQNF